MINLQQKDFLHHLCKKMLQILFDLRDKNIKLPRSLKLEIKLKLNHK